MTTDDLMTVLEHTVMVRKTNFRALWAYVNACWGWILSYWLSEQLIFHSWQKIVDHATVGTFICMLAKARLAGGAECSKYLASYVTHDIKRIGIIELQPMRSVINLHICTVKFAKVEKFADIGFFYSLPQVQRLLKTHKSKRTIAICLFTPSTYFVCQWTWLI